MGRGGGRSLARRPTTGGMTCLEHLTIRSWGTSSGSSKTGQEVAVIFLGVDWAEEHHDVCLLDEQGKLLGKARVANSLEGVSRIHALVAHHPAASSEPVLA